MFFPHVPVIVLGCLFEILTYILYLGYVLS